MKGGALCSGNLNVVEKITMRCFRDLNQLLRLAFLSLVHWPSQFGIPHFDSDDYFHYPTDPPFQKQRSPEERARLLSADLKPHSSWVLSGGVGTWHPPVNFDPTLVIFLYLPPDVRLKRLKERENSLYGSRILAGGDMEEIHREFMEWTAGYDESSAEGTNTLKAHEAYVSSVPSLLRLVSPLSISENLRLALEVLGV